MKLVSSTTLCWTASVILVSWNLCHPHEIGVALAWSPSDALSLTSTVFWNKFSSSSKATTALQKSSRESSQTDGTVGTATTTYEKESTTTVTPATSPLSTSSQNWKQVLSFSRFQSSVAVWIGTVLTYYLHNVAFQSWTPILASSIVGLVSGLTLPQPMALATLCGSFAGMASTALIPSMSAAALLGMVCAITMTVFDKTQHWSMGIGGRLGLIALCATTIQFLIMSFINRHPVITKTSGATLVGSVGDPIQLLYHLPVVCLSTIAGALVMSIWKEVTTAQAKKNSDAHPVKSHLYRKCSNSVVASSITGLFAELTLPPSITGPAYCGSFIAMTTNAKLLTYGGLVGACIFGSICQQAMSGMFLGGWGGKLGTAALLGVLCYRATRQSVVVPTDG